MVDPEKAQQCIDLHVNSLNNKKKFGNSGRVEEQIISIALTMVRDSIMNAPVKRRELIIFLVCFLFAAILNVIGIAWHHSPASELITQLHVVLIVALVIYGAAVILRILYYLISRFWFRR
jgi:F0F1-type ATP synthase membrane subunit a